MAGGILQIVSPDELSRRDQQAVDAEAAERERQEKQHETELSAYLRREWQHARSHRSTSGLDKRLTQALRTYNGEYEPDKLREIVRFGGSQVYARTTATKCRGATALLRDVYLKAERPWGVEPTPEPTVPGDMMAEIMMLVQTEVTTLQQAGQPITDDMVQQRVEQLRTAARRAARRQARTEAKEMESRLDDILVEGGFYTALAEFLVDLPMFPFAVIKGPSVRAALDVRWENGEAVTERRPRMYWTRVAPFDFYWTGGVHRITDGAVFERHRYTRADLNALLGVEGYKDDAIRAVLAEYGAGGLRDWLDDSDSTRADAEGREDPNRNTSNLIDALEFHGPIQGRMLMDWGLGKPEGVTDPVVDYYCQAFLIGNHIIKVRLSANPRQRHPYYVTSFDKMPGSVAGFGLVDILQDIQDVMNACLRSLVNNLAMASGPQVGINTDRMAPDEDPNEMYPWKRWLFTSDQFGGNRSDPPLIFFQPQSNANELLGVYEKFSQIGDEVSAIPRYIMGGDKAGGAGRTASGLAMMLSNASKVLQNVAANIDEDVLKPCLQQLHDMILLTDDTGFYTGDENIRVRGVAVAAQKETERARQLEWLQLTANPVDLQLTGLDGRAAVLKQVAETLGLDGEQIIPPPEEIRARMQAPEQQGEQQMLAGGQEQGGATPPQQREAPRDRSAPQMGAPRTNMFQDRRTG